MRNKNVKNILWFGMAALLILVGVYYFYLNIYAFYVKHFQYSREKAGHMYLIPKREKNSPSGQKCKGYVNSYVPAFKDATIAINLDVDAADVKVANRSVSEAYMLSYSDGRRMFLIKSSFGDELFSDLDLAINSEEMLRNKLAAISLVLNKTPDELSAFDRQEVISNSLILLHLKYGVVPAFSRNIIKIESDNNVDGFLINSNSSGVSNSVLIVLDKINDILYQINFSSFSESELDCIVKKIEVIKDISNASLMQ